jgi:hypothetical protein
MMPISTASPSSYSGPPVSSIPRLLALVFHILSLFLQMRQFNRKHYDINYEKHGNCRNENDAEAAAVCIDY